MFNSGFVGPLRRVCGLHELTLPHVNSSGEEGNLVTMCGVGDQATKEPEKPCVPGGQIMGETTWNFLLGVLHSMCNKENVRCVLAFSYHRLLQSVSLSPPHSVPIVYLLPTSSVGGGGDTCLPLTLQTPWAKAIAS